MNGARLLPPIFIIHYTLNFVKKFKEVIIYKNSNTFLTFVIIGFQIVLKAR